ncbi:MAG: hypothetical protein ACTHZ9_09200 [Leucobacter sp.]
MSVAVWGGYPEHSRAFQCGAWSWQLRGSEIADLTYQGRQVLRAVRPIVRDHDWNTPDVQVRAVDETKNGVKLRLAVTDRGASFEGEVIVSVTGARCTVALDIVSDDEFWTNRTGLVVLHAPSVAGAPLTVTHANGDELRTHFPQRISPHQPVRDVQSLLWESAEADARGTFRATFDGDVFEMEDQRNWTDASFKTYNRSLNLPFPYRIAAGERVQQSISIEALSVTGDLAGSQPIRIALHPAGVFPNVGTGAATAPDPAPDTPGKAGHVLVELDLATPNWRAALRRAVSTGAPLDVRIIEAETSMELHDVARALQGCRILRVAAYDRTRHITLQKSREALVRAMANASVQAPIVGGSRAHFTEFNREYDAIAEGLDGITFSLTPLFHDLSTEQLEESIAMQRVVVRQAVNMAAPLPLHVGPITLRPRFNNVATDSVPTPSLTTLEGGYGAEFTGEFDPRQAAFELAAWTAASIAALAIDGVSSLNYFEEWGPRGLHDSAGHAHPTAEIIALAASWSGRGLLTAESPDGVVWGVGARSPQGDTVLLANLGEQSREVEVSVPAQTSDESDPRAEDTRVRVPARSWTIVELG